MAWVDWSKKIAMGSLVALFALGCGSEPADPEFGFGETEMQNAVVGDWTGTMTLSGQSPTTFTLSIGRAPAMQPACGSRTFSSPLCIETSTMNLDATLTTADKMFDAAKLQGSFMVIGLDLQYGELSLDGAGINLVGQFDAADTSQDLTVNGAQSGSAVIQR
jgi:hypothetical protein